MPTRQINILLLQIMFVGNIYCAPNSSIDTEKSGALDKQDVLKELKTSLRNSTNDLMYILGVTDYDIKKILSITPINMNTEINKYSDAKNELFPVKWTDDKSMGIPISSKVTKVIVQNQDMVCFLTEKYRYMIGLKTHIRESFVSFGKLNHDKFHLVEPDVDWLKYSKCRFEDVLEILNNKPLKDYSSVTEEISATYILSLKTILLLGNFGVVDHMYYYKGKTKSCVFYFVSNVVHVWFFRPKSNFHLVMGNDDEKISKQFKGHAHSTIYQLCNSNDELSDKDVDESSDGF